MKYFYNGNIFGLIINQLGIKFMIKIGRITIEWV